MAQTGSAELLCARCGNSATLICKGCKTEDPISGSLVGTTRYCSIVCQKDDWLHHKAYCKATHAIRYFGSLKFPLYEPPAKEAQLRAPQTSYSQTLDPGTDQLTPHNSQYHEPHPRQTSTGGKQEAHESHQTPAQPNDSIHSCASCQNPATNACKRCEGAPDATGGLVEATYYCSPACQTANWSEHENVCLSAQARRKLYEAGKTLTEKYHGYCQGLTVTMVATGTLNASHMILHEQDSVQHTTNAIALFRDAQMDMEEQWACLACLVGSDHSGKMGAAVREDLKDLYTSIREVTVSLRTARRRLVRQDWQAGKDKHRILHVFMKSGEEYALDVSGVQFGFTAPVVPWAQYLEAHVRQVETWKVFDEEAAR